MKNIKTIQLSVALAVLSVGICSSQAQKNQFPNASAPAKNQFGGYSSPNYTPAPAYNSGGGVKNQFPNDSAPAKNQFGGDQSSSENTGKIGDNYTWRSTRTAQPNGGTTYTTESELKWGKGNNSRYTTSSGADGYRSTSDNTYRIGDNYASRSINTFDSKAGLSTGTESSFKWGHGNESRTLTGLTSDGKSYNLNQNIYQLGNGKTITTITGHDADGNYINKTINK